MTSTARGATWRRSRELGEHLGLAQNPYRWHVAMARIRDAEGDLDEALALVDEAERLYVGDFFPDVRPVAALKARLLVAAGRSGRGRAWARERGLSADDDLTYLREYEHITLARILLGRARQDRDAGSIDEASAAPGASPACRAGRRTNRERDRDPHPPGARPAGRRRRGCRAGAARAGPGDWPSRRATSGCSSMKARRWRPCSRRRRSAESPRPTSARSSAVVRPGENRRPADQALIEPLSERELEVLRLLATDLDGPDIARELVVSLNTVRTHTKNIYAKLGVNNRRAAVSRAAELDLLSRARER